MTIRVVIDAPLQIGGATGAALAVVPMTSGTVKTEPGFEPALDAELHGVGYDYIHNDANGENMRLDVRSQVKNKDGTLFAMYYKGTVTLTDGVKALFAGDPNAGTTPYGDSFTNFSFEVSSALFDVSSSQGCKILDILITKPLRTARSFLQVISSRSRDKKSLSSSTK